LVKTLDEAFEPIEGPATLYKLRLRDLQLLKQIAEVRSLTAIADHRGITQPALSRSLKDIEMALGAQVFERAKGAMLVPTQIGRHVLARAALLLADADALQSELQSFEKGRGAHLRLGTIPYVATNLLEGALAVLTQEPWQMSVSVTEGTTDQLIAMLRRQELDVVVGRLSADVSNDLLRERLFTQQAGIVSSIRPGAVPIPLSLPKLLDHEWVLPPMRSPTRQAFTELFVAHDLATPVARVETTSLNVIQAALRNDERRLALLPADIGRELQQQGLLAYRDFPIPFPMPAVGMISLPNTRSLPSVRTFRDVLYRVLPRVPM